MRQDLTKKMKANLERFRTDLKPVLHVGAAEHLVARCLIEKDPGGGWGRARASYALTEKGQRALDKL